MNKLGGFTRRGLAGVTLATTYYSPLMLTLDVGPSAKLDWENTIGPVRVKLRNPQTAHSPSGFQIADQIFVSPANTVLPKSGIALDSSNDMNDSGCSGGDAPRGNRSRSAMCSAAIGLLNRKPCISSQA